MAPENTDVTSAAAPTGKTGVARPLEKTAAQRYDSVLAPFAMPYRPSRKLPVSAANLVLAALFAAGVLCLYLLSRQSGPQKASAQEQATKAQVEAAIQQLQLPITRSKSKSETDEVVNTFYYEARERQIPISELSGNPYVYKPGFVDLSQEDNGEGQPAAAEGDQVDDYVSAVKELKLQSVLKGPNGAMAIISGNLVSEGQVIKSWTVSKIQPREVVLTHGSMEYLLQMPK